MATPIIDSPAAENTPAPIIGKLRDPSRIWNGAEAIRLQPNGGTLQFVAPEFLRNLEQNHPVRVTLIYRDDSGGSVSLYYDSHSPNPQPLAPLLRENSGQWRKVQWQLPDPRFSRGLEKADLKLESSDGKALTVSGLYLETDYPAPEDAKTQPGVPTGEVQKFVFADSTIFPGTTREVTVYVPRQYDGSTPACVWVSQDGMPWNIPIVCDNLIAKRDIPVMIAIGITPGQIPLPGTDKAFRKNRSFEYDTLSDDYVRFVTEEILPAVEKRQTSDGRRILLSKEAKDRGITGGSSGGICAFTAAWERPDRFSRVYSAYGSFDNLRNGDRYPGLIRKTEPKAIRIFLQDGSNDLNWYAGDWWLANQRLFNSLKWAGYETECAWSDTGHSGTHSGYVLPQAMRYLWKDWPRPVGQRPPGNDVFTNVILPGEQWEKVASPAGKFTNLAVDAKGGVYIQNSKDGQIHYMSAEGGFSPFALGPKNGGAMAVGSDQRLYQLDSVEKQLLSYESNGERKVVAENLTGTGIAPASDGRIFVSESSGDSSSRIWSFSRDGSKVLMADNLPKIKTLAISPNQKELFFGDGKSWIYSSLISTTLNHTQRWCELEIDTLAGDAGVEGVVALESFTFIGSKLGIQIFSNNGSIMGIIPGPESEITELAFGGPSFDQLYIVSKGKLYRRHTKIKGQPLVAR